MPNWCSNRLSVEGPTGPLGQWRSDVAGTDSAGKSVPLDFERVLPTPPEFLAGRAASAQAAELLGLYLQADPADRPRLARSNPLVGQMAMDLISGQSPNDVVLWDAFDWRTHNWGTKWAAAAESFRVHDAGAQADKFTLIFSTAWAPPRPLLLELIQRYRDLSFDLAYSEPDDGFAGRIVGTRGEVILDTETREPDEAIALLADAGWENATDDWREVDDGS